MRIFLQFAVFALLLCAGANAQDATFSLHFDGVVADRLAKETSVRMWSPYYSSKPSIVKEYVAGDFPRKLDRETFANRVWVIEFRNDKGLLFSVELSADLFDKPRKISVGLDAPKPLIRPIFGAPGDIRYTGNITRRMQYRDLPRLDPKLNELALSAKPTLSIIDANSQETLKVSEMHSGCLGFGWWTNFLDVDPPDKTNYEFTVTYDSGGLFEPVVTKCPFTFHKNRHGK